MHIHWFIHTILEYANRIKDCVRKVSETASVLLGQNGRKLKYFVNDVYKYMHLVVKTFFYISMISTNHYVFTLITNMANKHILSETLDKYFGPF